MLILLFILFLAMIAVDILAAVFVLKYRVRRFMRTSYLITVFLVFLATMLETYFFSYYENPNTRIYGWPIPSVVFQRDSSSAPWKDYIGPTIVLAYPMNFAIYMSIPSVVFIILTRRRQSHEEMS